jgi:hypothetical protein
MKVVVQDDFSAGRKAFQNGDIDLIYGTLDSYPVEMGEGSDMADTRFFNVSNFSVGADAIVVNKRINTVNDLIGKVVCCSKGTASHTLLLNTLETSGITLDQINESETVMPDKINIKVVEDGLAASAALAVSDIPFNGPISEVRVGRVNGQLVVNPTFSQMPESDIDIMVAATMDNIMMVEGEFKEVSEAEMLEAIKFAHEEIKIQCQAQLELMKALGADVKRTYCHETNDEELRQLVIKETYDKVYEVAKSVLPKHERNDKFDAIEEEFCSRFCEEELAEKSSMIKRYFHDDVLKKAMRNRGQGFPLYSPLCL